jgi:hypothetical protein
MQDLVGQDTMVREKERVSSMLAVATGLTMLRQAAKAKNQLRAIDRMPYKWDDGDDFERAWLMLANIHMQVFTSVGRVFDFVNNLQFWFFQKK